MRAGVSVLGPMAGWIFGLGCTFDLPNRNHCAHNGGDAHCESFDASTPYCALPTAECGAYDPALNETGCVERRPVDEACYSPCGRGVSGSQCEVADATTSADATSGSTGGSTDAEADADSSGGSTGPFLECSEDGQCSGDRPFCFEGRCVPCNETALPNLACEGSRSGEPFCVHGECVECRDAADCGSDAPICDPMKLRCVGCLHHEQCPGSACDMAMGECFEEVLYVDPLAPAGGVGTQGNPFAALADGIADVGEGERRALVLLGEGSYDEYVFVNGQRSFAFIGAHPEGRTRWSLDQQEMLKVEKATVYLVDLGMRSNIQGPAVRVQAGGSLFVDRSEILQNEGGGIEASGESRVELRNTFVGNNGSELSSVGALRLGEGSTATVVYSTIAGNRGDSEAVSISCSEDSSVRIRNAIVLGSGSSIGCSDATVTHSVVDTPFDGASVRIVGGLDPAWFRDAQGGDFHVGASETPFADAAMWRLWDTPVDIDADARPTAPNTPDYAGADRP